MKKRVLLAGLVLSLAGLQARAQVFRPGWVLLAQGDTLRGEIEDDSWDDAPVQVRFRPAAGAASRAYAPAEVRAFQLTGGRYFRYETLPLDQAAKVELNSLPYALVRDPQPTAFLVEVLVDGPASLLRTAFHAVQHYYVRREGQPVLEMAERRYIRQQDGHQYITDGNNYQAELLGYFSGCPAAVQAIGAFRPAALVAVVQAYNRQCATPPRAGREYRPQAQRPAVGYAIGLVAGLRYGSCRLQAEQPSASATLDGLNLDGIVHPVGGFFVDLLAPGRRSALHLAGLVTQLGRRAELATPGSPLTKQLDNQFTIVELRLGGRFFWGDTRRGQRFFAGTGITLGHALDYHTPIVVYYDASQPLLANEVPEPYPHSLLPYLEVGLQQGRVSLALDARTQAQQEAYLLVSPQAQTRPPYAFRGEAYTYRNWYLGINLGFALLQRQ